MTCIDNYVITLAVNLEMNQGSNFEYVFPPILNEDGSPVNLSGCTGICRMSKSYGVGTSGLLNIPFSFIDSTAGIIGISYNVSQIAAIKLGWYQYYVILTSGEGTSAVKNRVVAGKIEVK